PIPNDRGRQCSCQKTDYSPTPAQDSPPSTFSFLSFTGSPQRSARLGPRVLAILEHLDAVDEDVLHADGVLVRPGIRGPVGDGPGVEDDNIREVAIVQQAAMIQAEVGRGQVA